MDESINSFDEIHLYKTLDKWDETHLSQNIKHQKIKRTVVRRVSRHFEEDKFKNLNFKQKLSSHLDKEVDSTPETIKTYLNNLDEEKSNLVAQNINLMKKKFDFDIFKNKKQNEMSLSTNNTSTTKSMINSEKKRESPILKKENELMLVGNEIGIRKKIIRTDKSSETSHDIKTYETINVENQMLKRNDLKLEGNYENIISFDVYKDIVDDKRKIEVSYRKQIIELIKSIREKEKLINNLTQEFEEISANFEKKKNKYFESSSLLKVIKENMSKADTHHNFQKRLSFTSEIQELEHKNKSFKSEYNNQKAINERKIPDLKYKITYYKTELKTLKNLLEKLKKENILYFKNLLKEGVDVRNIGICWVLFRLYELGAKVENFEFPKFLDNNSIIYLREYTDKIINLNKLKIICTLIESEMDKSKNNINLDLNDSIIYQEKRIELPYDDINGYIKNKFKKFKYKFGNDTILKNEIYKTRDKQCLENLRYKLKNYAMNEDNKSKTQSFPYITSKSNKSIESIEKKFEINLTPHQLKEVNAIFIVKNLMEKIEEEMKVMRRNHLSYFKRKYFHMKFKGTSECIKYDLMFCALFGNFAVC